MGLTPEAQNELSDICLNLRAEASHLAVWSSRYIHDSGQMAVAINDASHTIRLAVRLVEMAATTMTE